MYAKTLPLLALSCSLAAQIPIYENGPLITHPNGNPPFDVSAVQNGLPHNMDLYGIGAQVINNNSLADNFATNGVWVVNGFEFLCYQTGAVAPSINDVRVSIYSSNPSTGGVEIVGSPSAPNLSVNLVGNPAYTVTNTMSNIQRTLITGLFATNRPLQVVRVEFATAAPLLLDSSTNPNGDGSYWIHVSFGGTGASGPWVPPVSILGSPATGSEALQRQGTLWVPLADAGFPAVPVPYPQALPFVLLSPGITSAPGAITNLGGSCGAATFEVRGSPAVGGVVHAEVGGTLNPLAIPLIAIGFTDPSQSLVPFCSCTSHASLDIVQVSATSNWQVPMLPSAVGFTFYMQGAQVDLVNLAGLACNLGIGFELTDGYEVRFY